ncbi:MAG: hypothetical protein MUO21_03275, partial [Nitrososphaeraceae archaeon]|nr:hypothetical protein [Nitrososphaeraceae archaeon]
LYGKMILLENRKLYFSINHTDKSKSKPDILYTNLGAIFAKILDRIGMRNKENGNGMRRKITASFKPI